MAIRFALVARLLAVPLLWRPLSNLGTTQDEQETGKPAMANRAPKTTVSKEKCYQPRHVSTCHTDRAIILRVRSTADTDMYAPACIYRYIGRTASGRPPIHFITSTSIACPYGVRTWLGRSQCCRLGCSVAPYPTVPLVNPHSIRAGLSPHRSRYKQSSVNVPAGTKQTRRLVQLAMTVCARNPWSPTSLHHCGGGVLKARMHGSAQL
ncbi:hypothetical protein V8C34DRAFT_160550 [Trichoderma compactum]